MKHACRITCCLGILLVLACPGIAPMAADQEAPTAQDEKNVQWGEEVEGYQLSISTEKSEALPNEPIYLRVALKNVGDSDATIVRLPFLPFCKIEARSKKGDVAPLTLYGRQASKVFSVMTQPLAKGDEFVVVVQLNRLYDMTPSGPYKVTATRTVWKRDGSGDTAEVVSNTIEVRVKDPGGVSLRVEETLEGVPLDDAGDPGVWRKGGMEGGAADD